MAKRPAQPFNTGVGRFIGGSCYQGKSLDDDGKPRVFNSGANMGQPRTDYSVGIAIKKTPGVHWANEPWGAVIWAEGHAAWPSGQASRTDFAWKIVDGDSTEPNTKMKRPCDQVGYPGNWILWFGGTKPPPVAVAVSGPAVWNDTPGTCMPGDYIEIRGSVVGNESTKTAGVYLNPEAVCLRGYHPDGRIASQLPDLATAGFGATPLPAGAVVQPAGNAMAPAAPPVPGAAPAATPSTPAAPAAPAVPGTAPSQAPAAPPVPGTTTPVVPNATILGAPAPVVVPQAPAVSSAPPAPPAPAARVMTAKSNGATYESFKASNWTDEQMVAEGYLVP